MPSERRFQPGRFLLGRGWWVLPALLACAVALPWLFGERWYSDGPYYQAISTQMAREGTWLHPMQGELPYFNKPPLTFWMHGALVRVFGDADWAAHLPEGAAFVTVCVLIAAIVRRTHGSVAGVIAGCVMAMTNDWIWRVGNFKLDSTHTMWLLGAVGCWVWAFVERRGGDEAVRDTGPSRRAAVWWCLLAGVCLGAALMTKPMYALGAGVLILVWLGIGGLWTLRRAGLVLMSMGIGVVVAAPWHVGMIAAHGSSFVQAYLHEQTVQRAIGEMHDHQPWYWYVQLIAGTLGEAVQPERMWPVYAGALVGLGAIAARWRSRRPDRAGDALAALWTIAWLVALSAFGGKRNYYLMVVHPGTAWLCAIAVDAMLRRLSRAGRADVGEVAIRYARGAAVGGVLAAVVLLAIAPVRIARERKALPVPERDEYMAFVRKEHGAGRVIYDCGITYRMAALTYIQAGVWPRWPSERSRFAPEAVPRGSLMAYRADMVAKGTFGTFVDPLDRLVFRSSPGGQYLVYERH